jgi:hypothetical protein
MNLKSLREHEAEMTSITADTETLFRQASMTARDYMLNARLDIDKQFGESYAAKPIAPPNFLSDDRCMEIFRGSLHAGCDQLGVRVGEQIRDAIGGDDIAEAIQNHVYPLSRQVGNRRA